MTLSQFTLSHIYRIFQIGVPFHKPHAALRARSYHGDEISTALVAAEFACSQRCVRFVKRAPNP